MDLLNEYSDNETSDGNDSDAHLVTLAPDVPLSNKTDIDEVRLPSKKPVSATSWNPAGRAQYFAVGDSSFSRQEYSFGQGGVFKDPESYELRKASTLYSAHPESELHAKHAKRSNSSTEGDKLQVTSALQLSIVPPLKRPRKGRIHASSVMPTSELHIRSDSDYLGRSWIRPSSNARTFEQLEEYTAFIPKRCIAEFGGAHKGGTSAVRFFPGYGHLLLSGGLDGEAKVWDVGKRYQCIRSYKGHGKGIRDVCFSNDGSSFLTASFDKTVKLWDTESGKVLSTFDDIRAIPYCVRFNPDEDKFTSRLPIIAKVILASITASSYPE